MDRRTDNPWTATPVPGVTTLTETFEDAFGPEGVSPDGEWTFTLTYNWSGGGEVGAMAGQEWTDATITLHAVPAPGVLALLGLVGFAAPPPPTELLRIRLT